MGNAPSSVSSSSTAMPNFSRNFSQIFAKSSNCPHQDIETCQSFKRLLHILTFYQECILSNKQRFDEADVDVDAQHEPQGSKMSVGIPSHLLEQTTSMSMPSAIAPQMKNPTHIQQILQNDEKRKQQQQMHIEPKQQQQQPIQATRSIYAYINHEFGNRGYDDVQLLNDYTHCLQHHASDKDFEYAHDALTTALCTDCDINQCIALRRLYANEAFMHHHSSSSDDVREIVTQHILDTIHSFFLHCYHLGFRLDPKQSALQQWKHGTATDDAAHTQMNWWELLREEKDDGHDDDEKHRHSVSEIHVQAIQRNLRQSVQTQQPFFGHVFASSARCTHNRYLSASDAVWHDRRTPRFYYWSYFEHNTDDDRYNAGDRFADWFVPPRYTHLKQELMMSQAPTDAECALTATQFEVLQQRVAYWARSEYVRTLACKVPTWNEAYGMSAGGAFTAQHIMAVVVYTCLDALRQQFVRSFLRTTDDTRQQCIRRHCVFANLGRYLRESVECFGVQTKHSTLDNFYHSVTHSVSITSVDDVMCAPVSTSGQAHPVLAYFQTQNEQNGLLLQLHGDRAGYCTYFDCRFLSDFGGLEQEQLWIGGAWPMRYRNILEMESARSLNVHLFALHAISQMFSGVYYALNNAQATSMDEHGWECVQQMMLKLIHHRLYKQKAGRKLKPKLQKSVSSSSSSSSSSEHAQNDAEALKVMQQKMHLIARRPSSKQLQKSSFTAATTSMKEDQASKDDDGKVLLSRDETPYRPFPAIPVYIEQLLDAYCNKLDHVIVDYVRLNKEKSSSMPSYRGYRDCGGPLFCLYKLEWIKLPLLLQMFPNCASIAIWGCIELQTKLLDMVLVVLVHELNKIMAVNPKIDTQRAVHMLPLKCIKIDDPQQQMVTITKAVKKYETKFEKILWRIYEDDKQLIMTSLTDIEKH